MRCSYTIIFLTQRTSRGLSENTLPLSLQVAHFPFICIYIYIYIVCVCVCVCVCVYIQVIVGFTQLFLYETGLTEPLPSHQPVPPP